MGNEREACKPRDLTARRPKSTIFYFALVSWLVFWVLRVRKLNGLARIVDGDGVSREAKGKLLPIVVVV